MKLTLTDKFIRGLKPAAPGKRVEVWDNKVDGFSIRVTDKGAKSYVLMKRWPPAKKHPARRLIGDAEKWTLAEARAEAENWSRQVAKGIDPHEEKRKALLEEQRKRTVTFEAVCEKWFAKVVRKQRQGFAVEREVRRTFIELWGKRPITEITKLDVRTYIDDKAEKTPAMAHNLLRMIKQFFSWVADQDPVYGINDENNPTALLSGTKLIGKKTVRKRILNDVELRACWNAAGKMGYPYGDLIRMLMLTGQRKDDVAEAPWSEFELSKAQWIIPAERMKMASAHAVPICDGLFDLLDKLPRFTSGDLLFSTSYGVKPLDGFSKAKERLDALMAEELDLPLGWSKRSSPKHFVFHDIRRTVRTGFSAFKGIEDLVKERVIAHADDQMHQIYDQWEYLDEKRECLKLWEARLMSIVNPPAGDNVVPLKRGA